MLVAAGTDYRHEITVGRQQNVVSVVPRLNRIAVGCALVLSLLGQAASGPAQAAGGTGPRGLVAVTPAARVPVGARAAGALPATAMVRGAVVLKPRSQAAAQRFITAVTTPSSPLFGRYLSPGAFARRFGPGQAAIDAIRSVLIADGLRVTRVERGGLLIDFIGPGSMIRRAFGTRLERYRLADGSFGQATTGPIRVPAVIAPLVSSVVGLDDLVPARPASALTNQATTRASPAARATRFAHPAGAPRACHNARAIAASNGGLPDDQLAHAYGAFGLYGAGDFGAGQHIAVYELEPFLRSDIRTFDTCYFGAPAARRMAGRLRAIQVD